MIINFTEEQLHLLKPPLGDLISENELIKRVDSKKIISIGDVITLTFIKHNVIPFVAVFDFKTMRTSLNEKDKHKLSSIFTYKEIINEKGTLNLDNIPLFKSALRTGGSFLVKGEEDLVSLGFLPFLNENYCLCYGQPNKGIVFIEGKDAKQIYSNFNFLPYLESAEL